MTEEKDLTVHEIGLSNHFVFEETMTDPKVAKPFLEELLGKKIRELVYLNREQSEKSDVHSHGVRLDVYIDDKEGTIYNIELQKFNDNLPKRSRYYLSGIDRLTLKEGEDYNDLRDSYVIFVCTYDPYERGDAKYERSFCVNGVQTIPYDDGSHVIFLNAAYKHTDGVSSAVLEFLDLVRTGNVEEKFQSTLALKAAEMVKQIRADEGKVTMYMTYEMELNHMHAQGVAQGRTERESKDIVFAYNYLHSVNEVAEMFHLAVDYVLSVLRDNGIATAN